MKRTIKAAITLITTLAALPGAAWAAQDVNHNAPLGAGVIVVPPKGGGSNDTTPPGTPTLILTAVPGTNDEIEITWNAPGDDGNNGTATSYELKYRDGSSFALSDWTALDTHIVPTNAPKAAGQPESYTVTVLPEGVYTFRLKTLDEKGNSSMAGPLTISLDTIAPGQVLTISTVSATQNSIVLELGATGDDGYGGTPDHYTLHYTTTPFLPGEEAALIADASTAHVTVAPAEISAYTIAGLPEATVYRFTVTASDENSNTSVPADMILSATGLGGGSGEGVAQGLCGTSATVGGLHLLGLAGLAAFLLIRVRG